ncbi:GNAT family N-acetyltransferase [Methylobacterium aquaticum]|uniref:GNAT family N-acetyltransferase n=1 Tax=Methylobacterium aquaticum TaxID=270351 RepID=UPI0019320E2F|nr:N-acetyltransferase [Methylobacterium aquaticum]QRE74733.1 N-acetyltransferase [Methylobacterium aquaticum]
MIQIRDERATDVAAREHLLDVCFGEARFTKTCERLREGRFPAEGLALVVEMDGRLVATVRLWHVDAGGIPALMLGPIAVEPGLHGLGIGHKLMRAVLARAASLGHRAVILVGDAPYYARFGFTRERVGTLSLPGPYAPERFLALDLVPGALDGATGMVRATGQVVASAPPAEAFRVAA